jgi:hypothetical protein
MIAQYIVARGFKRTLTFIHKENDGPFIFQHDLDFLYNHISGVYENRARSNLLPPVVSRSFFLAFLLPPCQAPTGERQ